MKKKYVLSLKEARQKAKLKQKELAHLANIPVSSISRYESNKRVPDIFTAVRLAKALGCNVDALIKQAPQYDE